MMTFLEEIKRRKLFQVVAVYAVTAWLLVQIVATIEEPLNLPGWFDTAVIVFLAVAFPITLIISWGYNLTSEGLVRDRGQADSDGGRGRTIEFVLIGLLLGAMAWVIYRIEFDVSETVATSSSVAATPASDESSTEAIQNGSPHAIAVLPLENLSPDPDNAYIASGIHLDILNQLQKIRDLRVTSRTSVLRYEDTDRAIPEIARELEVRSIMEGSVQFADGRIRIQARLIDGTTDQQLWSDVYQRDLADVFAIQAEIADQIAAALEAVLLPSERQRIERPLTDSAEAYALYLKAISSVAEPRSHRRNSPWRFTTIWTRPSSSIATSPTRMRTRLCIMQARRKACCEPTIPSHARTASA